MSTIQNALPSYIAIFKLTIRQLFLSRKGLLIILGCILSLLIAVVFRITAQGFSSVNSFIPYMTLLYYGFFTNLCAIFYGSAIVSDEIDSGGLTYLQMRPISKPHILLSKFAAYLVGTTILIGISHLLLTGIIQTHPILSKRVLVLGMSFVYTGTLTLGLFAYGTIAVLLSVRFKNPVLWGLLFVFGWERITVITGMPIGIKRISITHYLIGLFPDYRLPRDLLDGLLGGSSPKLLAVLLICLITVGGMAIAMRIFKKREYLM
ncbi:ABC transporter permease [Candidatus Poribacteria bacterium]|nr:ABC transporter permease [Candidatus Poribacteria bacterium]